MRDDQTETSRRHLLDQLGRIADPARAQDWLHETLQMWGTVQRPAASALGRPATHLWEIDALGVHATGASLDEALTNWRRVAANLGAAA